MPRQIPILLQVLLLVSLAIRLAVGAPCCLSMGEAETPQSVSVGMHHSGAMSEMAMADTEEPAGHDNHDGDNTANPCCSACGPILPQQPVCLQSRTLVVNDYSAEPEHPVPSLEAVRAYLARGPPSAV